MGVTTRAAAARMAQAETTSLLDLPDAVLERILVAASDGGDWGVLHDACCACTRLRAVADAATRAMTLNLGCLREHELAPLALLPRLGALARVQLMVGHGDRDVFDFGFTEHDFNFFVDGAEDIARAVRQ
jgi:hypothetical protein